MIDTHMDLIFEKEPIQSYLDAYLYNSVKSPQNVAVSENKALATIGSSNLSL